MKYLVISLAVITFNALLINNKLCAQSDGGKDIVYKYQEKNTDLRAGAARINITPDWKAKLGRGGESFEGIHDSLYCRALVISDDNAMAAVITVDIGSIRQQFWQEISTRLEQETGMQTDHILLSATHTHSGPRFINRTGDPSDDQVAYKHFLSDAIVSVVKKAQTNLQPARMGAGKGLAYINVNRVVKTAKGEYRIGQNPAGFADRDVFILKFESLDGAPIGIMINYAVHCATLNHENFKITSDIAGATSRMIETHYNDNVVALWNSGAAGDINPLFTHQTDTERVKEMAYLLGTESIRVAELIRTSDRINIRARQKITAFPAKDPTMDSISIRLSVLMLNHVALCGVSGEAFSLVGKHLKEESPFTYTAIINHCNGADGYLADDQAHKTPGYGYKKSRVKQGFEKLFISQYLDIMDGL